METFDLGKGAFTDYDAHWLDSETASHLQACLTEQMTWEQKPIYAFGKALMQPRLVAWAGDIPYRYSGQTLEPQPVSKVLADLMHQVSITLGVPFNHVLLNRYRDGKDTMGMHADNEPELGKNPTIASISIGAKHRFQIKGKPGHNAKIAYEMWL